MRPTIMFLPLTFLLLAGCVAYTPGSYGGYGGSSYGYNNYPQGVSGAGGKEPQTEALVTQNPAYACRGYPEGGVKHNICVAHVQADNAWIRARTAEVQGAKIYVYKNQNSPQSRPVPPDFMMGYGHGGPCAYVTPNGICVPPSYGTPSYYGYRRGFRPRCNWRRCW